MNQFRKVLAVVEIGRKGYSPLSCLDNFFKLISPESVEFAFVHEREDIPDEIARRFPVLTSEKKEMSEEEMRSYVGAHLNISHLRSSFSYYREKSIDRLLAFMKSDGTDLLIVGKNREMTTLGERLLRKSSCSCMVVPEGVTHAGKNITVAIDFSEGSHAALKIAFELAKKSPLRHLSLLHIYSVPYELSLNGMNFNSFREMIEEHATSRMNGFLMDINREVVEVKPLFLCREDVEEGIIEAAGELESDLLVLGARGRNPALSILLGSKTARIVGRTKLPVLSVRYGK